MLFVLEFRLYKSIYTHDLEVNTVHINLLVTWYFLNAHARSLYRSYALAYCCLSLFFQVVSHEKKMHLCIRIMRVFGSWTVLYTPLGFSKALIMHTLQMCVVRIQWLKLFHSICQIVWLWKAYEYQNSYLNQALETWNFGFERDYLMLTSTH